MKSPKRQVVLGHGGTAEIIGNTQRKDNQPLIVCETSPQPQRTRCAYQPSTPSTDHINCRFSHTSHNHSKPPINWTQYSHPRKIHSRSTKINPRSAPRSTQDPPRSTKIHQDPPRSTKIHPRSTQDPLKIHPRSTLHSLVITPRVLRSPSGFAHPPPEDVGALQKIHPPPDTVRQRLAIPRGGWRRQNCEDQFQPQRGEARDMCPILSIPAPSHGPLAQPVSGMTLHSFASALPCDPPRPPCLPIRVPGAGGGWRRQNCED